MLLIYPTYSPPHKIIDRTCIFFIKTMKSTMWIYLWDIDGVLVSYCTHYGLELCYCRMKNIDCSRKKIICAKLFLPIVFFFFFEILWKLPFWKEQEKALPLREVWLMRMTSRPRKCGYQIWYKCGLTKPFCLSLLTWINDTSWSKPNSCLRTPGQYC